MEKITADYLFTGKEAPLQGQVLIFDTTSGKIRAIEPFSEHDPASVRQLPGALMPGFVNAHCHLELSHMKGRVDTGTGLLPFLQSVVQFRDIPQEEIMAAIDAADEEMQKMGIVAVGDICNKSDTALRKSKSPIRYYSFVEMFDFLQEEMAEGAFQQYSEVYEQQSGEEAGNAKRLVPHAPYTVSPALFEKIRHFNPPGGSISIHNQETVAENELFLNKSGGFLDFYKAFNFPLDHFQATGRTSIHYALEHLPAGVRTLFVHNTLTTPEDIRAAQAWSPEVYWVSCPNANLYIENRLPNYRHFLDTDATVALGTDSLTSNWQLSILEEIKTIARYQSYVPLKTLVQWACLNGAQALGFDDELGSFTPGKTPGINWVTLNEEGQLFPGSRVERVG